MDLRQLTTRVDVVTGRFGPTILRWTAALLWLANVNWKVPPDFGRTDGRCRALCRFVEAGADHPVLPGSSWFFDHVVSPHLGQFGWVTLITEATLVVLLVSGRYIRFAAVLGIVQSVGIGLAVANADDEWYWSYLLMVALHLAILVTASTARPQSARAMAAVTAGYGIAVGIARAGAGFDGSGDWKLFSQMNDLPGEWGRGTFPGSIAIGIIFVALGLVGWWAAEHLADRHRRILGFGMVGLGALLLPTYDSDGLFFGLGSRPGNACILAALGLALAVSPSGRIAPGRAPAPTAADA